MNLRNNLIRFSALCLAGALSLPALAGNEDRLGSAGGTNLLINPWTRSAALGGANMASGSPVESMWLNVAGLAMVPRTEIQFSNVNWLSGSDISISSLGFAQRVGADGALGFVVSSIAYGDIERTTVDLPDGTGSFYRPNTTYIGLSYAKAFSDAIYGGISLKLLNESLSDIRGSGVAIDAGIRYVSGEFDQLKIGIALKNVGPPVAYEGDGLSLQTETPQGFTQTTEVRSEAFELPSLVNIGISYDLRIGEDHMVSPSFSFIANSFSSDQYILGVEYKAFDIVHLRAGMDFQRVQFNSASDRTGNVRQTALDPFSAGVGFDIPLSKGKNTLGIDYAYRSTNPFDGIHTIGARFLLGKSE